MAWLAAGCGAPFTNEPFLQEAAFLGALPSEGRIGAPPQVVLAPNGDSPLLAEAKQSAAWWDGCWGVAFATRDAVEQQAADERTDGVRRWEGVEVSTHRNLAPLGQPAGDTITFWAAVEVIETVEGSYDWTLSVAADPSGPYVELGAGVDEQRAGLSTFDVAAAAEALGLTPPEPLGVMTVEYDDASAAYDEQPWVSATWAVDDAPELVFGRVGDGVFGFTTWVELTSDGSEWPAYFTAIHTDDGGRAEGTVYRLAEELDAAGCWDASGNGTWLGGDDAIAGSGDPNRCAVGPF